MLSSKDHIFYIRKKKKKLSNIPHLGDSHLWFLCFTSAIWFF